MTDENNSPQGQTVYRQLLTEIGSGGLLPGARLRETELAERLSTSRTPVREAIRRLEIDGLVTHVPRQGATVRKLEYGEIVELYEMRMVLEGTAARLAARSALDFEIDELMAINDELRRAPLGPPAQEMNRQFHRLLIETARNRYLVKSVSALQKAMLILGPTTLGDLERQDEACAEHAQVIQAISARNGEAAEQGMRNHIASALKARVRALRIREEPLEESE